jgi:predicted Zn-dependent protease
MQILHAQLLLGVGGSANADEALKLLVRAKKTEGDSPQIHKLRAQVFAEKGDTARADLATAEFAYSAGDKQLAIEKAQASMKRFKRGTPEWLRANDILTFAQKKG